jgi:hypothetical protein
VIWVGLATVAVAAVLSFATVRDLANVTGYPGRLGWLLPITIDAGATVSAVVWVGGRGSAGAVRYARVLSLAGAAMTIAANALGHGLAAAHVTPPWWLDAALGSIPPMVLAATAHLVALLTRAPEHNEDEQERDQPESGQPVEPVEPFAPPTLAAVTAEADDYETELTERARRLVEQSPVRVGRRRLAELLDVTEHQARQLLDEIDRDAARSVS